MELSYRVKKKNNDEILFIYLDFNTEFSNEYFDKVKDKITSINKAAISFAKRIKFKGNVLKIVVGGVVLSTIILTETKANINEDNYTGIDLNTTELVTEADKELTIIEEQEENIDEQTYEKPILEINQKLLNISNKKVGVSIDYKYIVVHNTANYSTAKNEIDYLHNPENTSYTSFHFAVDESEIWQAVPLGYSAWHAGDGSSSSSYNMQSIGVEIARSTHENDDFRLKATENGAKLIASLMKEYDIPIENVVTHHDASGKYCPHDIFDNYGWTNFKNLVESYM